jgi:uncharacterized oxidoreductase
MFGNLGMTGGDAPLAPGMFNFGSNAGPTPEQMNGIFILALNVAWFVPLDQFREQVDQLTAYIKSARPLPGGGPVLIPGEPDREEAERRMREGIPFSEQAWAKVAGVLQELGLDSEIPEG